MASWKSFSKALDEISIRDLDKGGQGSGFHGHSGRPGQQGGSGPGGIDEGDPIPRRTKKEQLLAADAEKLAGIWKVPTPVAYAMLRANMVGVHLSPAPTVKPTESEAIGTQPGKSFPGKCYDMAARYVTDNTFGGGEKGTVLVHGTISDGMISIGHGWAETATGKVFDGTRQEFYDKAEYYRTHKAVAERTYTQTEMYKQMLKYRSYGPWHETAGFVRGGSGPPKPRNR